MENIEIQQRKNREMFNRIAGTYDSLNRGLSLGIDILWRKKAIAKMGIDQSSIILDVATGTGDLAFMALRENAKMVIGVDPAFEMIRKTHKKLTKFSEQFFAVESYGEQLPVQSSHFTHVMISYGMRNISDRKLALKEFYRVLRPGGTLAVLEFSREGVPAFQSCYNAYFHHILSWIGGIISGDWEAYSYLPKSVLKFPARNVFIEECEDAGFTLVESEPMSLGISTFYLFQK